MTQHTFLYNCNPKILDINSLSFKGKGEISCIDFNVDTGDINRPGVNVLYYMILYGLSLASPVNTL